jgi:hypothetical protein
VFCSEVKASADTGVIGVTGVTGATGDTSVTDAGDGGGAATNPIPGATDSLAASLNSAYGFSRSRRTLCGLNRNKPPLLQPARMFLLVKAASLAGL